jgi:hypothetical protein
VPPGRRRRPAHRLRSRALIDTIVIPRRFRGPAESGNGGYTCGVVAALLGDSAEVTLRKPPPLDRLLIVRRGDARVVVEDGGDPVAEAVPADVSLEVPPPVSLDAAEEAAGRYSGFDRHAFPECFVCGPGRPPGDGLRIFAGPVADRDDVVAAGWTPPPDLADASGLVKPEFVWASLDCPGAFATAAAERGVAVLGRLAARVDSRPTAGEPHVVLGWSLGGVGRKHFAGTALFSAEGELRAVARATWVTPRE